MKEFSQPIHPSQEKTMQALLELADSVAAPEMQPSSRLAMAFITDGITRIYDANPNYEEVQLESANFLSEIPDFRKEDVIEGVGLFLVGCAALSLTDARENGNNPDTVKYFNIFNRHAEDGNIAKISKAQIERIESESKNRPPVEDDGMFTDTFSNPLNKIPDPILRHLKMYPPIVTTYFLFASKLYVKTAGLIADGNYVNLNPVPLEDRGHKPLEQTSINGQLARDIEEVFDSLKVSDKPGEL